MSRKQFALFEDRFLESFAGETLLADCKTAIIELVANAWDAGATEVNIAWPESDGQKFAIADNGHGMTEQQFLTRYRKLAYNRYREQGPYAEVPPLNKDIVSKRKTFGRNGKGRLAAFAFGQNFKVNTFRDGWSNIFQVDRDIEHTLAFQKTTDSTETTGHGTEIFIENAARPNLTSEDARKEIGMRFLTDPSFKVSVNGVFVTFQDVPEKNINHLEIEVENIGKFSIKIIDVQVSDKTTQQHGIAWHVKNRIVGECTWKGSGSEYLIDGRKAFAKRYIYIVNADCLEEAVLPDWTGFYPSNERYKKTLPVIHDKIKEHLLELSKSQREETFKEIEAANKSALTQMGLVSRQKWERFIKNVQEDCPTITSDDLETLGSLLARLETSDSKYQLISTLAGASTEQLDGLTDMLTKWDIDFAKIVLDEIEYRTILLEKLQMKLLSELTDEVQDLQPLFHRALWIFGPEYETIEYTSNQGMTKVIQDLFGVDTLTGSRNRPDFAILPDSTVGMYSFSKYDREGAEIGIDRLTIVELKRPGILIGDEQKSQAWKYVTELMKKGLLKSYSKVTCFVLGSEIDPTEDGVRTHKEGNVLIWALDYDTVMKRAKSRLLKLHDKIRNASFLEDVRIQQYLFEKAQSELVLF